MHGTAAQFLAPPRDCSSYTRHASQDARDGKSRWCSVHGEFLDSCNARRRASTKDDANDDRRDYSNYVRIARIACLRGWRGFDRQKSLLLARKCIPRRNRFTINYYAIPIVSLATIVVPYDATAAGAACAFDVSRLFHRACFQAPMR